jgi:hypothetical protein
MSHRTFTSDPRGTSDVARQALLDNRSEHKPKYESRKLLLQNYPMSAIRWRANRLANEANRGVRVMADADDQWPLPNYMPGPAKHVHALGVASLNFNMYEAAQQVFLEFYLEKVTAEFLFDKMQNEQRQAAIRHFVGKSEKDPEIRELIEHSLAHYARCFDNRNILMHSKQYFAVSLESVLSIEKRPKGKRAALTFHLQLDALRRIADEMMDGVFFITDIWRVVDFRDRDPKDRRTATFQTPALPDKPPLPKKLNSS